MKKLAASILLLVYFTVSTGFVVSIHYCMNRVNGVELGDNSSEECGKCGMKIGDSDGCCKNDVKIVKMQVDQAFAKVMTVNFALSLPELLINEYSTGLDINSLHEDYPLTHGPPLSEQDIYLRNCVFRL